MSIRVTSPEFIGRARELGELTELAVRAADGVPGFVLIGGESGVGKSRLVAEFAARARVGGARVLTGDCVDLGGGELPYAPLVGALREVSGEEIAEILPRAEELAALLPQLNSEPVALSAPPLAQGRLFEHLLALLGGLSERAPLVLIVEDAHWADPSTRDFLMFLIRNRRSERLVVAVTYRTDEIHRRHPLRAFLAEADRTRTVGRLVLDRFTRAEIGAQLAAILGRTPAPQLVEELFERAEGNPFFTEELVAAGGETSDGRLPDDVRDALMLRIESLGGDAQAVLRLAAVAGARVRHALLVAAASFDEGALLSGLRDAVAHQVLIQEPDGEIYRFRHALLREAIADDLLPGERGPLHAALGAALARDPGLSVSGRGVAAELAAHWWAAHDLPAAFAASAQAGAEAESMAAWAEANAHFERAADLWDAVEPERRAASPSRVELLRRAADAALLAGDAARAAALARSALGLVDTETERKTAAVLHERIGRFLFVAGLSQDALAELRIAVDLMPADAPAAERARVLGAEGHLLMLVGHSVEAQERCEAALALAREAGARLEECRILNSLGGAQSLGGRPEDGIRSLTRARELAEELGDPEELTRSYINLAETLEVVGRHEDATEISRQGVAMARREGIPAVLPMLIAELSVRLIRSGGWDEAAGLLAEAVASTVGWGVGRASALAALAQLRALRGDADGAEDAVQEAEREQRQAMGMLWTAPLALTQAEAALWTGRAEKARAVVDAEVGRRDPADDSAARYLTPVLAAGARAEAELASHARATGQAVAEVDAVARARALADLAAELAAREEGISANAQEPGLHAASARREADRAAGAASAEDWAQLAADWTQLGNPYAAGYARWRQAELTLAAGGPRGDIPAVLSAAYADAVRLGADPLRRELEDLARRARIELHPGHPPEPGEVPPDETAVSPADRVGLTARELDVLRLLAGGATNREIATRLYISQKTVTVHVSHILSKLDARTRVEAAGIAQRLGLLDVGTPAS